LIQIARLWSIIRAFPEIGFVKTARRASLAIQRPPQSVQELAPVLQEFLKGDASR
jgi:hypothetical protein